MATPAQFAANIENSHRSTGPRTESGRQRVSENAITHGLTSSRVVLPNEDPAEFEAFATAVIARYAPATEDEHTLALDIAAKEWRLARAWRAHDHFLGAATISESEEAGHNIDPAAAFAGMLLVRADEARIRLILRYLRANERAHNAAITTLARAQKARLSAQPEPGITDSGPDTVAPTPVEPQPQPEPTVADEPSVVLSGAAPTPATRAERRAQTRAGRKAARRAAAALLRAKGNN